VVLRLLLPHVPERRCRRLHRSPGFGVLDLDAFVLGQGDRGLDLDDGGRSSAARLSSSLTSWRSARHRIELRFGQRLSVDIGDQVLGHSRRTRRRSAPSRASAHVALSESGQARHLLHATVRPLPLFLHDVHRRLDGETPLAAFDRLDRDSSTLRCGARGKRRSRRVLGPCGSTTVYECDRVLQACQVPIPQDFMSKHTIRQFLTDPWRRAGGIALNCAGPLFCLLRSMGEGEHPRSLVCLLLFRP